MEKPYNIRERALLFADQVFDYCRKLRAKGPLYAEIVEQLNDAAGSIGANLAEAKDGESKKDFIHKNAIALKEANEANYWLRRAWSAEDSLRNEAEPLIQESRELISNGAFLLSAAESDRVQLERAKTYWDDASVSLDRVTFINTASAEDALTAYRDGEIDAITNAPFEPLAFFHQDSDSRRHFVGRALQGRGGLAQFGFAVAKPAPRRFAGQPLDAANPR